MLRRLLFLLILVMASPLPPAAAHDGMPPAAMAGHAMPGSEHKVPMPADHICVGCAPIGDWQASRVTPPVPLASPAPVARIIVLPLLPGEAPLPPPPRIA